MYHVVRAYYMRQTAMTHEEAIRASTHSRMVFMWCTYL
jgi:hypothetical protein